MGAEANAASKDIVWKLSMSAAEQKATAVVGDSIVFKWDGSHDVYTLPNQKAFDDCDFTAATKLGEATGIEYKAKAAGTVFFGCKVAGHCTGGQKLALTVTAAPVKPAATAAASKAAGTADASKAAGTADASKAAGTAKKTTGAASSGLVESLCTFVGATAVMLL